ncbi:hypothetical protein ABFS82_12G079300 [Erythranthe guttata]
MVWLFWRIFMLRRCSDAAFKCENIYGIMASISPVSTSYFCSLSYSSIYLVLSEEFNCLVRNFDLHATMELTFM